MKTTIGQKKSYGPHTKIIITNENYVNSEVPKSKNCLDLSLENTQGLTLRVLGALGMAGGSETRVPNDGG